MTNTSQQSSSAPASQPARPPSRLSHYLRAHLSKYLLGALMLGTFQLAMNRIDWLSKQAIDGIFHSAEGVTASAMRPALWMLALAVVAFITRVASRLFMFNAGRDVEYTLRAELLARLHQVGMAFYRTLSAGEIMSRATNDLTQIRLLAGFGVMNVINVLFALGSALQIMVSISGRLTLVSLATLPLLMVIFPAEAIWPALSVIVTMALLSVRSPGITIDPA